MTKEIGNIKGNEDTILPIIMKNDLPMTLKEMKDINEFLNGEKGFSHLLKLIQDEKSGKYSDEFKEGIRLLHIIKFTIWFVNMQWKIYGSIKENTRYY